MLTIVEKRMLNHWDSESTSHYNFIPCGGSASFVNQIVDIEVADHQEKKLERWQMVDYKSTSFSHSQLYSVQSLAAIKNSAFLVCAKIKRMTQTKPHMKSCLTTQKKKKKKKVVWQARSYVH